VRIDVVTVIFGADAGDAPIIEHFENAFESP
jgi:hypothetical protein